MELHHSKHHQTYVNSYNDATEKMAAAEAKDDVAAKIALQPLINFHGGGHVNHTLFWENLAPKSNGGGEPPTGALAKAIDESYGSLDGMKTKFNTALAGIQGSGWAWLVKDAQTGHITIKTYAVRIYSFLPFSAIVTAKITSDPQACNKSSHPKGYPRSMRTVAANVFAL